MDILLNLSLGIIGSLIAAFLYQHGTAIRSRLTGTFASLDLSFSPIDASAIRWLNMIVLAALSAASLYVLVQGINSFIPSSFLSIVLGIGIQGTLFIASWIVAPNPTKYPLAVILLAPSMAISIFFTFHYLYGSITQPVQAASNLRDTRSQVIATLAEIEFAMRDQRARRVAVLTDGDDWNKYAAQLESLMRDALANREAIEKAQAADNERLKSELANLQKRLRALIEQIEKFERNIRGGAASPSQAFNMASERVQRVQDDVDALNRFALEIAQEMEAEASGGSQRSSGRPGLGPRWKEQQARLAKVKRDIDSRQTELRELKRELEVMQAQITELGINKAEQATLQSQIQELGALPNIASVRVTDGGTISNSLEIRVAELQHSRAEFRHEWSSRALVGMETNCRLLLQLVTRTAESGRKVDPATCDATAFLGTVSDGAKFEAELAGYRDQCTFTREISDFQSVARIIERGRRCLVMAGLEPSVSAKARYAMDQAERFSDPSTSRFEVATLALARGDDFAWLSLVMAFLMQLLLPMGAVFATRVAVAPAT